MEKHCGIGLAKLKEEYKKIQSEHSLPDFEKMNKEFQIERISEIETDFLEREIRKYVVEKISSYMRFIETVLNPANSPMFVFSVVKSLDTESKESLNEIYKKLSHYEIEVLDLDTEYSIDKEINFIKNFYKEWQSVKKDFLKIVEFIKINLDKKSLEKDKSYFG